MGACHSFETEDRQKTPKTRKPRTSKEWMDKLEQDEAKMRQQLQEEVKAELAKMHRRNPSHSVKRLSISKSIISRSPSSSLNRANTEKNLEIFIKGVEQNTRSLRRTQSTHYVHRRSSTSTGYEPRKRGVVRMEHMAVSTPAGDVLVMMPIEYEAEQEDPWPDDGTRSQGQSPKQSPRHLQVPSRQRASTNESKAKEMRRSTTQYHPAIRPGTPDTRRRVQSSIQ